MRLEDISGLPPRYQQQILKKLGEKKTAEAGKSKYGNRKTEIGNLKFDSEKEANRFLQLKRLEEAGEITDLRLQVSFTLIEGYTKPDGERVRPEKYLADFTYRKRDPEGNYTIYIVEDVKSPGTRTEKYRIKKKQMREKFGVEITEIL